MRDGCFDEMPRAVQLVFVTHGQVEVMVRWLSEQGLQAQGFKTEYGNEEADGPGDRPVDVPTDKPVDKPSDEPEGVPA